METVEVNGGEQKIVFPADLYSLCDNSDHLSTAGSCFTDLFQKLSDLSELIFKFPLWGRVSKICPQNWTAADGLSDKSF